MADGKIDSSANVNKNYLITNGKRNNTLPVKPAETQNPQNFGFTVDIVTISGTAAQQTSAGYVSLSAEIDLIFIDLKGEDEKAKYYESLYSNGGRTEETDREVENCARNFTDVSPRRMQRLLDKWHNLSETERKNHSSEFYKALNKIINHDANFALNIYTFAKKFNISLDSGTMAKLACIAAGGGFQVAEPAEKDEFTPIQNFWVGTILSITSDRDSRDAVMEIIKKEHQAFDEIDKQVAKKIAEKRLKEKRRKEKEFALSLKEKNRLENYRLTGNRADLIVAQRVASERRKIGTA